jgi:hypothetical protein
MRPRNVALGCLAIPGVLILIVVGVFAVAFLMGPVDLEHTSQELEQELPESIAVRPDSASGALTAEVAFDSTSQVLEVSLDFEEGEFEIRPGAPGEPIQVEADYDQGAYRLQPTYQDDLPGGSRFDLLFERTSPLVGLRQLLHRQENPQENRVRVFLPPGVPMRLLVRMRKGAAQCDFSGLSLVSLRLDVKMGSTQVEIDEPNPVPMEYCDIETGMGEMRFYGLGFAAPRDLRFKGRMGEFELDLEGPGLPRTNANFNIMMGELRVEVPRETHIVLDNGKVTFGELLNDREDSRPRAEESADTPSVWIDARVRFGSLVVN